MEGLFITGTDTVIGKTIVCGLLARFLSEQGKAVVTQKWIQTGCDGFLEDIESHWAIMGIDGTSLASHKEAICPYCFKLPASAHLAAEQEGAIIDPEHIKDCYHRLEGAFESVLVEGLGGVLVPYSRTALVVDIVAELGLEVCVVAQNKLGAINHTLLTIEALKRRDLKIVGVIYNSCLGQDRRITADNPRIIEDLTGIRSLGVLPWMTDTNRLYEAFMPIGQILC